MSFESCGTGIVAGGVGCDLETQAPLDTKMLILGSWNFVAKPLAFVASPDNTVDVSQVNLDTGAAIEEQTNPDKAPHSNRFRLWLLAYAIY